MKEKSKSWTITVDGIKELGYRFKKRRNETYEDVVIRRLNFVNLASQKELIKIMGVSDRVGRRHLKRMEAKGLIKRFSDSGKKGYPLFYIRGNWQSVVWTKRRIIVETIVDEHGKPIHKVIREYWCKNLPSSESNS